MIFGKVAWEEIEREKERERERERKREREYTHKYKATKGTKKTGPAQQIESKSVQSCISSCSGVNLHSSPVVPFRLICPRLTAVANTPFTSQAGRHFFASPSFVSQGIINFHPLLHIPARNLSNGKNGCKTFPISLQQAKPIVGAVVPSLFPSLFASLLWLKFIQPALASRPADRYRAMVEN